MATETYPTYEELGREIVEGADVDSLDLAELIIALEEEFELETSDEEFSDMSDRERLMLALKTKLRMGDGFATRMFGIEIDITPKNPSGDPIPPGPWGSDPSNDHEPREPHGPVSSGSESLEAPVPQSDEQDSVQAARAPVII